MILLSLKLDTSTINCCTLFVAPFLFAMANWQSGHCTEIHSMTLFITLFIFIFANRRNCCNPRIFLGISDLNASVPGEILRVAKLFMAHLSSAPVPRIFAITSNWYANSGLRKSFRNIPAIFQHCPRFVLQPWLYFIVECWHEAQ